MSEFCTWPSKNSSRLIRVVVQTFPAVLGWGAGLAVVQGVFDYTGGQLTGYERDPNVDEYERKEQLRKNKRRPIQEIIEQLGEGRGRKLFHIFCEAIY